MRIARDTGRAQPQFNFNIPTHHISEEERGLLDNCMIHILRNALDHGIEDSESRAAKGKTAHGTITVDCSFTERDTLTISIKDDGKGLNLPMLRRKGLEKGILADNANLQEIAEVVFGSGVSTAAEITKISGRGVGLNAVREYIEKAGGSINIELQETATSSETSIPFSFLIKIPLSTSQGIEKSSA